MNAFTFKINAFMPHLVHATQIRTNSASQCGSSSTAVAVTAPATRRESMVKDYPVREISRLAVAQFQNRGHPGKKMRKLKVIPILTFLELLAIRRLERR